MWMCCVAFSIGYGNIKNRGGIAMKNGKEGMVREIMMGSPVTLKPEDTLDLANDVISLGRIRHIPVVEDGRLVGLLSERDLLGRRRVRFSGSSRGASRRCSRAF